MYSCKQLDAIPDFVDQLGLFESLHSYGKIRIDEASINGFLDPIQIDGPQIPSSPETISLQELKRD